MCRVEIQLQQELLKSDCDVIKALRIAHLIETNYESSEINFLIKSELNGYDLKDYQRIPDYRFINGIFYAKNNQGTWGRVIFKNNETEQKFCHRKIHYPLSSILEYVKSNSLTVELLFPSSSLINIAELSNYIEFKMVYNIVEFKTIIESVKNILLEWITHMLSNKNVDNCLTNQIYEESYSIINNYGTINNEEKIIVGNNNSITSRPSKNYELLKKSIQEELNRNQEIQNNALKLLDKLNQRIENNDKPNKIKVAFIKLKNFLIDVGAKITVQLIEDKMQGRF